MLGITSFGNPKHLPHPQTPASVSDKAAIISFLLFSPLGFYPIVEHHKLQNKGVWNYGEFHDINSE